MATNNITHETAVAVVKEHDRHTNRLIRKLKARKGYMNTRLEEICVVNADTMTQSSTGYRIRDLFV